MINGITLTVSSAPVTPQQLIMSYEFPRRMLNANRGSRVTSAALVLLAAMAPSCGAGESALKRFQDGGGEVANAVWWGFEPRDSTHAIQGAINSGARQVRVPFVGEDWVVRPIKLASNQEIVFDTGVVVVAKKDEFRGTHECLFEGVKVSNVVIRGYGATLRMRKADYTQEPYSKSEWRHALSLKEASNVRVFGLTLEHSGGDGIYVGPTGDEHRIPCRDIVIQDCTCADNYRQGISVVSVQTLTIENCKLLGTNGTAPQAGIDLEPSHPKDVLGSVIVSNCIADGNAGSGLLVNLSRLNADSQEVSVDISNLLVRNSRQPALRAIMQQENAPDGLVQFTNCTSEDIEYSGATCIWKASGNLGLRFVNCKWSDVARLRTEAPLHLELQSRKTAVLGGVEFVNCYVYDDLDRDAVRCPDAQSGEAFDLSGAITVVNTSAAEDRLRGTHRFGNLDVQYVKQQP